MRDKMNTTQIMGFLVAGSCLFSGTIHGDDKPGVMTGKDWKQFADVVSTQDEKQVEATMQFTQEATCFFTFLAKADTLTATPTNIVKDFFVTPYPPTFAAKHPLTMMVEVTLRDAQAGKQRYFMERISTNTLWRMTEGWAISTNGQKGVALPLPSENDQKAANTIVSGTGNNPK